MNRYKFFFLLVFSVFSLTVAAQKTSADLKREKEALQRDIERLQKDLNVAEKNKKLTLVEVNALRTKISLRQKKIAVINSEVKNLDTKITENTGKVRNLQGQLAVLKKEYASMIRFAQRNKNAYDKMMFIFAASDFNQAYKRIKYLQQFGQYRKKQAGYIEEKKTDLNQQIVVLDKDLKEKSNLLHAQEAERNKLVKSRDEQASVLKRYSKQEKDIKQDINKRRQQSASLTRLINQYVQREMAAQRKREEDAEKAAIAKAKAEGKAPPVAAKKPGSGDLSLAPEVAKLAAAFESNKGSLPWPVTNKLVTEGFGEHRFQGASYHNDGINIKTSDGASVRSVFDGEVTSIAPITGKWYVMVNHGKKYITIYGNMKSVSVSMGQKVTAKQIIGSMGESGEGAELQFRVVKVFGVKEPQNLNPESWLAN